MNAMVTVAKKSNDVDFLEYSYSIGVRDFRINMDYENEADLALSTLEKLNYQDINVFADFQGVKMRIQLDSPESIVCKVGDVQDFYIDQSYYPHITNYSAISKYLKKGHQLCIADGKIIADIVDIEEQKIVVKFMKVEYVIKNNAGCSFLGDSIPTPRMTREMCRSIANSTYVNENRVNWVILSFVDSADEISTFVENMHEKNIRVMAKIETVSGVKNIGEIGEIVDGFMIGRGDLKNTSGVNYLKNYVEAINSIRKVGKGYNGVGTFFLSHFSDTKELVENEKEEVLELKKCGFDYVMLSKEVINGNYPYETVRRLQELCKN